MSKPNSNFNRARASEKAKRERLNNVPSAVEKVRAPLPDKIHGEFFVLECVDKTAFTLFCLDAQHRQISFELEEDELRPLLIRFGLEEVPRIVSAVKYNRRIQVIPNFGKEFPHQIISLYPKTPPPQLDWEDDKDHRPVHELPRTFIPE